MPPAVPVVEAVLCQARQEDRVWSDFLDQRDTRDTKATHIDESTPEGEGHSCRARCSINPEAPATAIDIKRQTRD